MSREPFLINPPRRVLRRKRKPNPWKGQKAAHKVASLKGWKKRISKVKGTAISSGYTLPRNPFGEEVIIVGANPKRRRIKRVKKRNAWRGNTRKHSVAAKKGWRKKRRNPVSMNPRKNRKRSYKRNPFAIPKINNLVMPTLVVVSSAITTKHLPSLLKIESQIPRIGVQAAVAFGVPMLAGKFLGPNKQLWTAVSLGMILLDLVEDKIVGMLSGYGDFNSMTYNSPELLSAFPEEVDTGTLAAFPDEEMSGYPTDDSVEY